MLIGASVGESAVVGRGFLRTGDWVDGLLLKEDTDCRVGRRSLGGGGGGVGEFLPSGKECEAMATFAWEPYCAVEYQRDIFDKLVSATAVVLDRSQHPSSRWRG